jgi:hypothetical protein
MCEQNISLVKWIKEACTNNAGFFFYLWRLGIEFGNGEGTIFAEF